jgi:hypothetical protein
MDWFLEWTGLWMVFVAPREFPEEGPRYVSLCMGLLWPMGMLAILASWIVAVATASRCFRSDERHDLWFLPLIPVAAFVGMWVVGYVQLRVRGATPSQRRQFLDAASRWMGNEGWVAQLLLFAVAYAAMRVAR